MHVPAYLLIPALAAVVYTVAALCHKRGYAQGAGVMTTFHWANLLAMPFAVPLFFIRPQPLPLLEMWRPAVAAALIYCGSWATLAAVRRGDVSMVTPVLGTKVVFVAAGVTGISGLPLSAGLWAAAVLATLGIFVMGRTDWRPGSGSGAAIWLCLAASVLFGLTDVLIAQWVPLYGGNIFLGSIPLLLGAFSLAAIARAPSVLRLERDSRAWVLTGGVLLAAQSVAMGIALAFFNDPTGVNVLYSTRGLWSIVLVWGFGAWFGNRERHTAGRRTMLWRLAGTLLITVGVVIAVVERSQAAE